MHNLLIEEQRTNGQERDPFIYINNPIESKMPYAYLTLEEFKNALTNRIEVQRQSLKEKTKDKIKYTIKVLHKTPKTKSIYLNLNKSITYSTKSISKERNKGNVLSVRNNTRLHETLKIHTVPKHKMSSLQRSQDKVYNRTKEITKSLETTKQKHSLNTKTKLNVSKIENNFVIKNVPETILKEIHTRFNSNDLYLTETPTERSVSNVSHKNDLKTTNIRIKDKIKIKEVTKYDQIQNKTPVLENSLNVENVNLSSYNEIQIINKSLKATEETTIFTITQTLDNTDGTIETSVNSSVDTEFNISRDTISHTSSTFTYVQRQTPKRRSTTPFVTEFSSTTLVFTNKDTPKRRPTQEHSKPLSTVTQKRKTLGVSLHFIL